MAAIDLVVAAILALAFVRGLLIGLIREAFSIAALGGAIVAVRIFTDPVAAWLRRDVGLDAGDFSLRLAAAVLLLVGVVAVVVLAGRILRRGIRAAGLGWADRVGGGVLGTAEGLLVAGLLLGAVVTMAGRDHELIAESRSLSALDEARGLASRAEARVADVAAPPPGTRR